MGGSLIDDDWEFTSSNVVRTLVLIGNAGNGKSATGNSILGREAFESMFSFSAVTSTCELQRTVMEDGQILNVIDTPGLFDLSSEPEIIGGEIVRCINMAKDGIHAILVVLSVRSRFTPEEFAAVQTLQNFFGSKIADYMIVVFTGGDAIDAKTLDNMLARCPKPLKETLDKCGNRRVLFDNVTNDERKKAQQLQELLFLVNQVIANNGGKPYTDDIFVELKKGAMILRERTTEVSSKEGYSKDQICELQEQLHKSHEGQMKRITDMVETKLKETTLRLEQQLAEEQAARMKLEASAQEAQMKSNDEIRKLRENLERAQRETEELRKQASKCLIL